MKKLLYINYLVILAALLVCGCEKVIEPKELPEQDPRLVVNSILYADSNVRVNITSSKSILSGKAYKVLDNAICKLFEDDNFVEQLSNNKNGNYNSAYLAKADKKYSLQVHADGFVDVEGSAHLPQAVKGMRFERYDTINNTFTRSNSGG